MSDTAPSLFTPAWFRSLLTAQLGFGDTFWIGNFGTGLILVPAHVVLVITMQMIGVGEGAQARVTDVLMVLFTLYFALLLRAVFLCARRTPEVGGWRWVGVIYTALNVVLCALMSSVFLGVGAA